MSAEDIKAEIISMLTDVGEGLSFVNLSEIEGFKGDLELEIEDKNIILWSGVSQDAITGLNQLMTDGIIDIVGTSELTYIADGTLLAYPIAKSNRQYKTPRWLPSVINKGRMFDTA
jgi:hypothetical protein